MSGTWKDRLLGRSATPTPPRTVMETLREAMGPRVGHTVDLLAVTPHGGDLHLVTATVDGAPFCNYIFTGDLHAEDPADARRIIARRVRALTHIPEELPSLTGREVGLP